MSLEDRKKARVQSRVIGAIEAERDRQDNKWGEQHHPDGTSPGTYAAAASSQQYINDHYPEKLTWAGIFLEEVWEALSETDPERLKEELVQCAAVAAAWVEDIEQR